MSFWRGDFPTAREDFRVAIVVAEFNNEFTEALLENTVRGLVKCGIAEENIETVWVPGSFELPFAVQKLTAKDFDSIIALGCIIRGETLHFELVAENCASGIMRVNLESEIPVIFGVLAVETAEQAAERIPLGMDFAKSAVKMMNFREGI